MFFDESRPDRIKRARKLNGGNRAAELLRSPIPPAKQYTLFTLDELINGPSHTLIADTESYANYWLAAFKCIDTGKIVFFEDSPESQIDINWLGFVMHKFRIVGFNSRPYDLPIIQIAMQGARAETLNNISNEIIREEMQPYQIERKYGVKAPNINHIDLIEVAPISTSLKIYAARLHCERLQGLPFPPETKLTKEQAAIVRDYCVNDLDDTHLLFNHLQPFITMREQLGEEYNRDLRSKSDAQIAEAVIVTELEKLGPIRKKREWLVGEAFNYKMPQWLHFTSPQLRQLQEFIASVPLVISGGGKPKFPSDLKELSKPYPLLNVVVKEKDGVKSHVIQVRLGDNSYTVAMGGLHSNEESVFYRSDQNSYIVDRDVASYYPYIVLNDKLFPEHLGEAFLEVYRNLVMRRLKLKKEKNPLEAGLKIAINGIFGKFGNIYSAVYSPDLLAQVTITGQLALFMQIEMLEYNGIPCVSANTDGAVYICPKMQYAQFEDTLTVWEGRTGFVTEETRYSALYSRDVNNYMAVKELENGKNFAEIKTKGIYSERGSAQNSVLSKNPEGLICSEAVQAFLANSVPLKETIYGCCDIRKFVSVRSVKGGGEKDGVYLGKAVRWYYAKDETGTIKYIASGNNVPKSEGAKPLMLLPSEIPADLDFDHYYNEAIDMLYDLGFYQREKVGKLI
jgi:hypothetical protein